MREYTASCCYNFIAIFAFIKVTNLRDLQLYGLQYTTEIRLKTGKSPALFKLALRRM